MSLPILFCEETSSGSGLIAKYPLISNLLDTVNGYSATFTRSTTKHFSNDSGVYSTAAIDAPAYTGSGILLEPASTNLDTYSYDISDASYAKTRLTATTATVTGPDGATSAGELEVTTTSASGAFFKKSYTISSGQQQTIKFICKYDNCPFLFIQGYNLAETAGATQFFNISNNTLGTYSSQAGGWTIESATIEARSDGYSEITLIINTVGTGFSAYVYLCAADADSTCTAGQKVKYYNFSVQENNTSAIRNGTGAALTRTVDTLSVPTTAWTDNDFSFYGVIKAATLSQSATTYILYDEYDVNYNMKFSYTPSGGGGFDLVFVVNGLYMACSIATPVILETDMEYLITYKDGTTILNIDGTTATASVAATTVIHNSACYIGSDNSSSYFNGVINNFKSIPTSTITLAQAAAL